VKDTAIATLTAIMGRESAYTGKAVTWDEMMASDLRLGPTTYALGPLNMSPKEPIPGQDSEPNTQ
jgi:myo-inositol 2-dehydrogenase/D-chiro-inositol 1-dehydrogenase